MKILVAPDKFKDCLSARAVTDAIAAGFKRAIDSVQIDACPMADGGEGTVDALVAATGGRFQTTRVTGPLPDMRVEARWGILGDGATAAIEMAAASGIELLKPEQRDPTRTTTYGTGQLILTAIEKGASRIILGIGGSATTDGGVGCAQACGLEVLLENGRPAGDQPLVGGDLNRVTAVRRPAGSALEKVAITVATDVSNPLCGPRGAARVFGPQKGADARQVQFLDDALGGLARRCCQQAIADMPGAGAAGGLGFGMAAFFGAALRPGIDIVIDAVKLHDRLRGVDLCITGEGRLDRQSLSGKTAVGVARAAQAAGVPCIALVGCAEPDMQAAYEQGITAYFSICDGPMTLEQSMADAPRLLAATAENVARVWARSLKSEI